MIAKTAVIGVVLLCCAVVTSADDLRLKVFASLGADRVVGTSAKGPIVRSVGSKKSFGKGSVAVFNPAAPLKNVAHRVLVTRISDISGPECTPAQGFTAESFLALSTLGHLVIVPDQVNGVGKAALSAEAQAFTRDLEQVIASDEVAVSIYFVKDGEEAQKLLDEVNGATPADDLVLAIDHKDVKKLVSASKASTVGTEYPTIAATLKGGRKAGAAAADVSDAKAAKRAAAKVPSLPTIAVAVSPDTMGVAPGLVAGGGSGLAVWSEVLRQMSNVYRTQTDLKMNLIFLLGSAGRLNYAGTAEWVQQQETSFLDDLEFVLCLDDLVTVPEGNAELNLHVSRSGSKDASVKDLYASFGAEKMPKANYGDVEVKVNVKKINVSHPEIRWEHETFAYRNVLAGTLSARVQAPPQLSRQSIAGPGVTDAQVKVLAKQALFLSHWLLGRLGLSTDLVTEKEISATRIEAYLAAAVQSARPAIPETAAHIAFFSVIRDDMNRAVGSDKSVGIVVKQKSTKPVLNKNKENALEFYGPIETTATLHKAKVFAFEATITAAVAAYLFGLATVMYGPGAAFEIVGLKKAQ